MDPVELIYDGVQAECQKRVDKHHTPVQRFRASESNECSRRIWYRLSGYKPEPDAAWLKLVAEEGGILHDYVRQLMVSFDDDDNPVVTGITVTEHGEVKEDDIITLDVQQDGEEFTISARADATLNGDTTLEIKTMGHFPFYHLNNAFLADGPKGVWERMQVWHKKYITQTMVTALLQGHRKCYLMVINRSNMQVGLYNPLTGERHPGARFLVDQELITKIMKKFARIRKAVRTGRPPTPGFVEGSQECSWCPWLKHCWQSMGVRRSV